MPSRRAKIATVVVAMLALAGAGGAAFEYRSDQQQLRAKAEAITGGSVARGKSAFANYGCGGCHTVGGGVPQAQGLVGPVLDGIAGRAIVGGKLANEPANLRRWIEDPQAVTPGTAMPDLGVSPADSRDIAAFLYTRT